MFAFLQRSLASTGVGLLLIAGVFGSIMAGAAAEGHLPRVGPLAVAALFLAAGAAHLWAATGLEEGRRWAWIAVALEVPIVGIFALACWPLRSEELAAVVIVSAVPVALAAALARLGPPVGGGAGAPEPGRAGHARGAAHTPE